MRKTNIFPKTLKSDSNDIYANNHLQLIMFWQEIWVFPLFFFIGFMYYYIYIYKKENEDIQCFILWFVNRIYHGHNSTYIKFIILIFWYRSASWFFSSLSFIICKLYGFWLAFGLIWVYICEYRWINKSKNKSILIRLI